MTSIHTMIDNTLNIKLTNLVSGSSDIETSMISSDIISSSSQSLTTVILDIINFELFDPLSLASIIPSLHKNGDSQIVIKLSKDANTSSIHTAIVLAGLTSESERIEEDKRVITSSYKPSNVSTVAKINTVQINVEPDLEDDHDLIDEDDLLNDFINKNELNSPPVMEARKRDYCEGWKPCDNCTCGRKEEMEAALRSSKLQVY